MKFQKAKRTLAKLRLALTGTSGSGKTYGALKIAKGLGGRIAVIDTERGSASLYADLPGMPEFDVLNLEAPFSPENYIEAIKAAEESGEYDILIIDSITHEWSGIGGCLEINDQISRAKYRGNTWSAWNEVTPRHRKFIDAMLQSKLHIIATLRSKTDSAQEKDSNGRTKVVKLGMKVEQRDGIDYEFTLVFDITADGHFANASKDRTALFTAPVVLSEEVGQKLRGWIETAHAAPPPPPAPDNDMNVVVNAPAPLPESFLRDAREAAESGREIFIAWGKRMAIEQPQQLAAFKASPAFAELYGIAKNISTKE